jgi:hypothetical protein
MAQVTYSALKFDKGMTPKVFDENSATRIEHFDTITEVLRPFRTMTAGTHIGSSADLVTIALKKFTFLNDTVYGLGVDLSTPANGAVYSFDGVNGYWTGKIGFGAGSSTRNCFIAHSSVSGGAFWGIRSTAGNDFVWKLTAAGVYTASYFDIGAAMVNGVADPIVHSKDGIAYMPIDNKIVKIPSDGTSVGSVGLTLPNANFWITSICEQGNYINIAGIDTKSGKSSSLLWDRDSSVVDLTESYDLSNDVVLHNGNILGTTFFVQLRVNSSSTSWSEQPVLIIKWLNGQIPTTLYEFPVSSCYVASNSIGAKYVTTDRFYFSAIVKFIGESTARNIVFCLDEKGRLTIAQNVDVDTSVTNVGTGLIRVGEGFWVAKPTVGAWNTTTSYTTIASYETNDIRAKDLSKNLDFQTGTVTCEPLPSTTSTISAGSFTVGLPYTILVVGSTDFTAIGASANTVGVKFVATGIGTGNGTATLDPAIVVKMRKNEETTFTTVAILKGANTAKFTLTGMKVKNTLNGLDKARQVRVRLESTVGAVITGCQFIFNEVADDTI